MNEFWEDSFRQKQAMWGFEPAQSAIWARDLFVANTLKEILIPGFGYGRNAAIFRDAGMAVSGIEISATAIDIAKAHFNNQFKIINGSVTDMPFEDKLYDGIFCFGLAYLLNATDRKKFISDCFNQLQPGGYMIFSVISTNASTYGQGHNLSKDRYEIIKGVKIFFYSNNSIKREFGRYGLTDIIDIYEPNSKQPFLIAQCRKY
jgi:SAM-dependent methyltransferase